MKYNHIAKTLGWDETPETSEGLFLQPEEAASLDVFIGAAAANEATPEIVAGLNGQLETLTAQVTERDGTIANQGNTIADLQARVAELGRKPSGTGTAINTAVDTGVTEGATPSYLDDSNPANQYADRIMRGRKK